MHYSCIWLDFLALQKTTDKTEIDLLISSSSHSLHKQWQQATPTHTCIYSNLFPMNVQFLFFSPHKYLVIYLMYNKKHLGHTHLFFSLSELLAKTAFTILWQENPNMKYVYCSRIGNI